MNNSNAIACKRSDSVLENEINLLKRVALDINRLANNITEMLGPGQVSSRPPCTYTPVTTVAQSINEIRTDAEEAKESLEWIARCLNEQLGELKLEY